MKYPIAEAKIEREFPDKMLYIGVCSLQVGIDKYYHSTVPDEFLNVAIEQLERLDGIQKFIVRVKIPYEAILEDNVKEGEG